MEWYMILALVGVGIFTGFINILAGSGSLITLPFLVFLGLDPHTANGTNRIGILFQSLVGVTAFKKQKVFTWKETIWLAIPAIIGSVVGSRLAVDVNEDVLDKVIGGLLIFMFFFILIKPNKWLKEKSDSVSAKPGVLSFIIFFVIGIYGGFIQAGVGFFLLAGLVLGAGMDLIKANAIKVLLTMAFTPLALAMFIYYGQVNYEYGFILAGGNMIGAFIGTKVSVSWGPKFVRYVLLATLLFAGPAYLGVQLDFF
ncbi:MAG: sulfite exporter TauE/SafE family protein [Bacteroidales bacterium]|nr:sulfite exporter TauE/SafE family protein [Bacteroidales bacterium]